MIDRGIPVAIRRGSAKTNSEHEQTDASRELDPMLSEAGLVPNKYLCVHFSLDSGSDFIDASSAVDSFQGLGSSPRAPALYSSLSSHMSASGEATLM